MLNTLENVQQITSKMKTKANEINYLEEKMPKNIIY